MSLSFKWSAASVFDKGGQETHTIGSFEQLLEAMGKCTSSTQAQSLRVACIDFFGEDDAKFNIGYLLGYFKQERRAELSKWFDIVHPIWGNVQPTVEQAIRGGIATAKLWKPGMTDSVWPVEPRPKKVARNDAEWNL